MDQCSCGSQIMIYGIILSPKLLCGSLTLVMAGSRRVQRRRGGGPTDPPPNKFAQNSFLCPKFGMLIPQGISNYVEFVSYNYPTYPAQGGDSGICPQEIAFCIICLNPTLNPRFSSKQTVFKIKTKKNMR